MSGAGISAQGIELTISVITRQQVMLGSAREDDEGALEAGFGFALVMHKQKLRSCENPFSFRFFVGAKWPGNYLPKEDLHKIQSIFNGAPATRSSGGCGRNRRIIKILTNRRRPWKGHNR